MSERKDRLRAAMNHAKITRAIAKRRFGWNDNTLKANLAGDTDFSYARAQLYGRDLKVRAEWLYSGEGDMHEPVVRPRTIVREIPVLSWVSAGQLTEVSDLEAAEELERITVSGLPSGDYFVLDVQGDSMDRISPDGSRIIVRHDRTRPRPGGFYVLGSRGATTFKRFYDDPIRFEPFSTNPANRIIFPRADEWEVVGQVVRSFIDLDRG